MSDETQNTSQDVPEMDYAEHDRTFALFMTLTKWGTIASVAVLIAMAFGFFAGGGLIGGTIVFFLLLVLAAFML